MPSWAEEIIKSVSVGSCVFFILAVVIMLAFRLNEGLGKDSAWYYRLIIGPLFRVSGAVLLIIVVLCFNYMLGEGARRFISNTSEESKLGEFFRAKQFK